MNERDSAAESEGTLFDLPLFPLGMVQFPTCPLELQIFEPRYLQMLEDLKADDPQEFGVVAISSGHEVGEENLHGIAALGCAVRVEVSRRVGSRVLLRSTGTWRFDSIEVTDSGRPYLTARVRPLPDIPPNPDDDGGSLRTALIAYADAAGLELGSIPVNTDELCWWIASGGPLSRSDQLRVLAASRPDRLELLTRIVHRETRLLRATDSLPFHGDRRFPEN